MDTLDKLHVMDLVSDCVSGILSGAKTISKESSLVVVKAYLVGKIVRVDIKQKEEKG